MGKSPPSQDWGKARKAVGQRPSDQVRWLLSLESMPEPIRSCASATLLLAPLYLARSYAAPQGAEAAERVTQYSYRQGGLRGKHKTEVRAMKQVVLGAVLAAIIGTWLVWYASSLQTQRTREMQELIMKACAKALSPEHAAECFYTTVVQTGGIRQ